MNKLVMVVDDDERFQDIVFRLISPVCKVAKANSGDRALRMLEDLDDAAVVIADYRMEGMNGVELLKKIADLYPDTIRILCTGLMDGQIAIDAVNEGHIFKFIQKPPKRDEIVGAVTDGIERFNLKRVEKELLEKTLQASVQVLTELLGMVDPASFSRSARIYRYVRGMCSHLDVSNQWQLNIAALLSQIGCVSLPSELVQKTITGLDQLSDTEIRQFIAHASLGANLLGNIPRMETVAEIIRHQFDPVTFTFDEYKQGSVDEQKTGSQLLRIAFYYDIDRMHGRQHEDIITDMRSKPKQFFGLFLNALNKSAASRETGGPRRVALKALSPGMVLAGDVRTENSLLVASNGQEITEAMIQRIKAFDKTHGIRQPLTVHLPG
ncbi:response regulator [bacterium]|nr:response regulator [bacterium]